MFLSLLQFFATKFLFLALHLESGSFPRPLSPQEEIKTFSALREGDPSARESSFVITCASWPTSPKNTTLSPVSRTI